MKEEWKDIPEYEGLYRISNFGSVYSLIKDKVLKPAKHKRGYEVIVLSKDKKHKTYLVHRLVAKTFIPNPQNKIEVNHKDGNKNNNNVLNLEWCTREENTRHAFLNGLRPMQCKIKIEALRLRDNCLFLYQSMSEASRQTGVNLGNISRCCNGKCNSAGGFVFKKCINNSESNEVQNEY